MIKKHVVSFSNKLFFFNQWQIVWYKKNETFQDLITYLSVIKSLQKKFICDNDDVFYRKKISVQSVIRFTLHICTVYKLTKVTQC